jgi:outer membrane protein assembly factor BamA
MIGPHLLSVTAVDRLRFDEKRWKLTLRTHYSARSDASFYGIGPDSREDDESRYGINRFDGSFAVDRRWGDRLASRVGLEVGYRSVTYDDEGCCEDPSIGERAATGAFPLPPGFGDEAGFSGPTSELRLELETRDRPLRTGVGLLAMAEQASDLDSGEAWLRLRATLGASVDVNGRMRMIGLILDARMVESITGGEIPFSELIALGGSGPLSGFSSYRLLGESGLAARAEYEWPVAVWLSGVIHVATGNVFGEEFDGFSPGLLRLSTGVGLRSISADHRLEMLLAIGTETFDDGAEVDTVRFTIGGVTGF